LRRFVSFVFACALAASAGVAHAQTVDIAVGGSTIWSPKNPTASVGFLPPAEKGGVYPSVSAEYILPNHFGFLAEGAFRYKQGNYNDFQPYRAIFYDLNGVYTSRLARKTRGDFMAGIGAESLLFYDQTNACNIPTGGCSTTLNSNHFLLHAGVGVKYDFWRNFFVRPEAHWNYILNNHEFHSNNVFRVGVSVGYTFGQHKPAPATAPAPQPPPAKPPAQPQPTPPNQ
jgi:hypothetical protein